MSNEVPPVGKTEAAALFALGNIGSPQPCITIPSTLGINNQDVKFIQTTSLKDIWEQAHQALISQANERKVPLLEESFTELNSGQVQFLLDCAFSNDVNLRRASVPVLARMNAISKDSTGKIADSAASAAIAALLCDNDTFVKVFAAGAAGTTRNRTIIEGGLKIIETAKGIQYKGEYWEDAIQNCGKDIEHYSDKYRDDIAKQV